MLGLAAAQACDGQLDAAVDGLREAAAVLADEDRHGDAMSLYARALMLDPSRLEIHLDVALLEKTMGRHEVAVRRIEGLADRFIDQGRSEEAARLLRQLASWEDEALPPCTETVVCSTFLLRPDGTPFVAGQGPELPPEQHIERAVSAPIVLDPFAAHDDDEGEYDEPEPAFETEVTTVASLPTAPPRPPVRAANGKFRLERAPRPGSSRPGSNSVEVQGAVLEEGRSLRSGTIVSRTPSPSRAAPPQPPRNAPRRSGESVVVRRTLRTDIEDEITQRLRRIV